MASFVAVDVVGVADERLAQLVRGAGELRQNQGAPLVEAAGHVLLGHQVHPVPEGRDDHDVGGEVQRRHLLLGK